MLISTRRRHQATHGDGPFKSFWNDFSRPLLVGCSKVAVSPLLGDLSPSERVQRCSTNVNGGKVSRKYLSNCTYLHSPFFSVFLCLLGFPVYLCELHCWRLPASVENKLCDQSHRPLIVFTPQEDDWAQWLNKQENWIMTRHTRPNPNSGGTSERGRNPEGLIGFNPSNSGGFC